MAATGRAFRWSPLRKYVCAICRVDRPEETERCPSCGTMVYRSLGPKVAD